MTVILVTGSTETAAIDGISAAGSDPEAMYHTPAADLEIVEYGNPVFAPMTPVSPSGCPTPALITRAIRELCGFEMIAVESGLATQTATPTVTVGTGPGGDIRESEPVPGAKAIFERARTVGRQLPEEHVYIGESIPGGTTTALGVLTALGEPYDVSSSLPENPLARKRDIVATSLAESDISEGDASGNPLQAVRLTGDPVLPAVMGLTTGALETDTDVTLAGGTQMVAGAALIRHYGITEPLQIATTSFVAEDTPDLQRASEELDLGLTVTDPEFEQSDHTALTRYCQGEAKEGVGMGGALALATQQGVPKDEIRERIVKTYEESIETDGH